MSAMETRQLKVELDVAQKLQKIAEKRGVKAKLEAPWATLARDILKKAVESAEGAQ